MEQESRLIAEAEAAKEALANLQEEQDILK